jgi:DNA-binding CsgD family transcriptional regulator
VHGRREDPAHIARLFAVAEELARIGSWELDLVGGASTWSAELYRIHGLAPGSAEPGADTLLERVHAEDRRRIAAVASSLRSDPVPGDPIAVEYRAVWPDGAVRDMRALGRVERKDGAPIRVLGFVQDVTDQRLTERELRAHYGVSQALREWESFEEGAVALLRRIGTALDYAMGSVWLWSAEGTALECRAFWHAPHIDPGDFELVKRAIRFRAGEGKPGRAWQTHQPVVTPDIEKDSQFTPREQALEQGLRSALAFPAVGPDGPVAVISMYSFEARTPSRSLIRTLTSIGDELGRFLSRRRGQLEASRLSDRELEVLRLASDGLSGPEIADRLVISPSTVKTHFENVYEKLGVSDRPSAVALALRRGLIR